MKCFAFVENGSLIGVGQVRMMNGSIQNVEISQDVFESYLEEPSKYVYLNNSLSLNPAFEKTQQEKIQKKLTQSVQDILDAKAQELLYDSCLSVCSYIDTGVPKFDAEGRAFRAWRSAVWAKGYEILAQVQAGQRAIPTEEQLIAELPKLVINY